MSKISYALLRRKRSPKTPNIPESTTFQDMHHHMRNMMTPDFSQTGKVFFNQTAAYTVHGSLVHRYILRPTRTFQSRRWSPNQLFGNSCILSSATRIGINLHKTCFGLFWWSGNPWSRTYSIAYASNSKSTDAEFYVTNWFESFAYSTRKCIQVHSMFPSPDSQSAALGTYKKWIQIQHWIPIRPD